MLLVSSRLTCLWLAMAFLASAQVSTLGINVGWSPITDAERHLAAPSVEKDAGVEALFWRVHVLDEVVDNKLQRALHHYVRLKVFNDRGKEKASTIDIPYTESTSVMYIEGRTVKADGTVVPLQKDTIHERDLIRIGRLKRRQVVSNAGGETGALECRWKELRRDTNVWYFRLQLQREFPVQNVTYFIKPMPSEYSAGYTLGFWPFNCKPAPLKLDNNGFNVTSVENVSAFKEEPMMPAEANVRPWILIFYHNKPKREPESYWEDVGKEVYRELKQTIKLSSELKQAADKAVQGAKEDEKILALIRYIRKNMRGLLDENVTEAERSKVIKSMPKDRWRNSAEIFESGIGMPNELNTVFAAMASHVGFDARPVLVADRNDLLFNPRLADRYFLRNVDMAVKQGESWKIFDVSTKLLAPDMLSWQESGMGVLVSDPKKPFFIETPIATPEASLTTRTARLALKVDGSLSGTVEESFTGYTAYDRRQDFTGESESKNAERIQATLMSLFPKAVVSDIKVENVEDSEKPFVLRYSISIPQYAQRTGKRLFLQPLIFQRGDTPMFPSTERVHDIYFRYAWKENDDVSIDLPQGFLPDSAVSPGVLNFGEPGSHVVQLGLKNGTVLAAKRSLRFGASETFWFPKTAYPQLKKVFDEFHRRDTLTMALKAPE